MAVEDDNSWIGRMNDSIQFNYARGKMNDPKSVHFHEAYDFWHLDVHQARMIIIFFTAKIMNFWSERSARSSFYFFWHCAGWNVTAFGFLLEYYAGTEPSSSGKYKREMVACLENLHLFTLSSATAYLHQFQLRFSIQKLHWIHKRVENSSGNNIYDIEHNINGEKIFFMALNLFFLHPL